LIHRLTSGCTFATDPTNASRTLLYDVATLRWDPQLCELFGIPLRALPEVRESFANFGETIADGALPSKLPICGVMGDSQASLFSQRCYTPGMAKATFGSGTSVMLNVGDMFEPTARGAVSALAWVHNGKPTYALEGLINYSSATIAWLKDQLGLIRDATETESLATAVPDNGGAYLVPAFAGLSAPYWSPEARAALVWPHSLHAQGAHRAGGPRIDCLSDPRRARYDARRSRRRRPDAPRRRRPTRKLFLMQFGRRDRRRTGRRRCARVVRLKRPPSAGCSAWACTTRSTNSPNCRARMKPFQPQMTRANADQLYAGWRAAVKRVL
jgi:glycerol kinase